MTGPAVAPPGWKRDGIVDADFEVVADRKPGERHSASDARLQILSTAKIETPVSNRAGSFFWTAGMSVVALAFWLSGGHSILHARSGFSLIGEAVVLAAVETRIDKRHSGDMLLVDGEAHNRSPMTQRLPPISVAVSSPDGVVTRFRINAPEKQLATGEIYRFSSRLRVPAEDVKSVAVTLQPLNR